MVPSAHSLNKKVKESRIKWEFSKKRGEGRGGWSPIATRKQYNSFIHSTNQNTIQKVNIFGLKNVPNVLKCKINNNFTWGSQTGGGSPTWEKFPHFPFFLLTFLMMASLIAKIIADINSEPVDSNI